MPLGVVEMVVTERVDELIAALRLNVPVAPTGLHVLRHSAAKLRRDAGDSVEAVSAFLDHSSLAVTTVYLRRLEGEADRTWAAIAAAIGV